MKFELRYRGKMLFEHTVTINAMHEKNAYDIACAMMRNRNLPNTHIVSITPKELADKIKGY